MKKLLLGITVLALILFASSAMAQTAKVPKTLCLSFSSYYQELVLKSMGTISASNGKLKMYSVTGHNYTGVHSPIYGSGYVAPGTTIFHATYAKMSTGHVLSTFELSFDLVNNTGNLYGKWEYEDGSISLYDYAVSGTNCSALSISIPSAMTISGPDTADGQ